MVTYKVLRWQLISICEDLIIKKVNAQNKLQVTFHKILLNFLVTGEYEGRTEEVVSLAMLMLKVAATDTVPSFLTHTFDEVSV